MADVHETSRNIDSLSPGAALRQQPGKGEERPDQRRESGAEMRRGAQDIGEQSKELAAEYYQQGRETVLEWERQLTAQVHAKPLQSLLIAAGIGLLLGLLRRR